jgi:hypothetical protein
MYPAVSSPTAAQTNAAFTQIFANGGTVADLNAGGFSLPNVNSANAIKVPMYEEWNFMIQQGISTNTSLSLNYVGNHGYHETVQNEAVNGYCPPSSNARRVSLAFRRHRLIHGSMT